MRDFIDITPWASKACAIVRLPGSKSITNRAMLLASLRGGRTKLCGALFSRDTLIMADCLKRLGYDVEMNAPAGEIEISSKRGEIPNARAELFVGNAGTAARFITALACLKKGGEYFFDSDGAMYSRPMGGLIDALKAQGAVFEFLKAPNCFPFRMRTDGLAGGDAELDASQSSQMLSALLMVSGFAESPMRVKLTGETVSRPFVDMTMEMLRQFGFSTREDAGSYEICAPKDADEAFTYPVEPDATAASYFAMLCALLKGCVALENFAETPLQGDAAFIDALVGRGLLEAKKSRGNLVLCGAEQPSGGLGEIDFNDISDTFLTLAAAACALKGSVKISGIAHTRKQETDRVAAMARELKKLCARVEEGDDSIEIFPHENLKDFLSSAKLPVEIETYDDHRVAMSFGVLGGVDALGGGAQWLRVMNPACASKTWAEFFDVLKKAREDSARFKVVAIDGGAAVGKSSVSKEASKALGFMHVDTGSHYRTLAYALLERGVKAEEGEGIGKALAGLELGTALVGQSARMTVNGSLIDDALIRTQRVNENVSLFAAVPEVREFLKSYQRSMREYARANGFGGLIMEGRDIGSVIFPDAETRIFLDADEETRQKRRAAEGITDSIAARDALDKSRKTAPLVCPAGAHLIDTSRMTKDEVVAETILTICIS